MAIAKMDKETHKIDVFLGYDANGKRIRHTETFHGGSKEAKAREAEIKANIKTGTFVRNNGLTFEEFANKWINEYAEIQLAPKTVARYKDLLKRIIPGIGYLKLKDVSPLHLITLYNDLRTVTTNKGTTLSEKTIKHYYCVVSSILNAAVNWELLVSNPNDKVPKPKPKKKEVDCYSPEDVQKLIKCLLNEPIKYRALIMLAIDTGMRKGEITGLSWDNVDLDKQVLRVVNSTQYISGKGIIEKGPKNESSVRTVTFTKVTADLLRQHRTETLELRLKLGSQWIESDKVFITDFGGKMHPDTPYKIFKKLIKKYILPDISFHALRHTSVSLLINSNVHIQLIAKRVGHSSPNVTQQIYAHIFEASERQVADTMNGILDIKANSHKEVC
ncbi:MAG TPA: site-specific integrase [Clostridiales bacterium]|nr:MAG: hypothetical protein A2Y22_04885 [Clostridiales bacterium GWD2_32_59]HAN10105.1 site-specific integrase [Clostridiales bacterium]